MRARRRHPAACPRCVEMEWKRSESLYSPPILDRPGAGMTWALEADYFPALVQTAKAERFSSPISGLSWDGRLARSAWARRPLPRFSLQARADGRWERRAFRAWEFPGNSGDPP